jgi:hypothetical protein
MCETRHKYDEEYIATQPHFTNVMEVSLFTLRQHSSTYILLSNLLWAVLWGLLGELYIIDTSKINVMNWKGHGRKRVICRLATSRLYPGQTEESQQQSRNIQHPSQRVLLPHLQARLNPDPPLTYSAY